MQNINNRTQVRGPPEQRVAPDARMVSVVAGRDCGPPSSVSPRLYRPFTPTTTSDPSSPRAHPATPGHPPLRSGAAGIVLRASPPRKRRSSSTPSTTRPTTTTTTAAAAKRGPLPPSFPLFFGAAGNQSSASIAPSTAEVRPAPVDGGTAALRELNTNFPSNVYRHISAKSSGAQSKTYSQPVIVRTYNGPYGGGNKNRNNSGSRPVTTRTPLPASSDLANGTRTTRDSGQILAGKENTSDGSGRDGTSDDSGSKENGVVNDLWTSTSNPPSKPNMPRQHPPPPKKRGFALMLPWQRGDRSAGDGGGGTTAERPKYPPLEAFTMKGIIQAERFHQSELDVSLDQIAELYARSRYSLSNQYEVHVTPHGSGLDFAEPGAAAVGVGRRKAGSTASTAGGSYHPGSYRSGSVRRYHGHQLIGPTLQATWSEDEADESSVAAASMSTTGMAARSHRKRRNGGGGGQRRKSAAYGTLETIMSSSRSSSEDKEKKKSASELTEEVRGRAERAAGRKNGKYGEGGSANTGQQTDPSQTAARGIDGRQTSSRRGDGNMRDGGGSPGKRKGSASFAHAVIDSSRSRYDTTSPRGSASALRRVAPGWLDSDARILEPERKLADGMESLTLAGRPVGGAGGGTSGPGMLHQEGGPSEMAAPDYDPGSEIDRAFAGR
ncbi:hypothetical protein MAPG_05338 [Magnaporthiopsis poae ATCC 64411]|uniref:Uncharacterized protein n=1 Tax=Magnaporthiopsis poae (strain ATCC 64411 / 73-15) TaxID=644358 RepID=A0A0C4DZ49_MAGP6|nr:hypothetical protein MAPG_05338 [Magnaporthiopsis poae ATCC 64411]